MRCFRLSLALTLAVSMPLCAQSRGYADAAGEAGSAAAIERGRRIVRAALEESGTPGMSVAVAVGGRIVWAEGFGLADVEDRSTVWEETRFRIGSISKPLTAAAVAQLVEGGRLNLDATVQTYVPSFPTKRWPITTRQVAGHLAGIRHYNGDEFLSSTPYRSVLAGLAIFQDDSLLFEPGTKFRYSSYGWNLVSAVVEGASGESFLPYMRDHVFRPLGMTNTVADHVDSIIPQRTRFYDRDSLGFIMNAPFVDNSYKWAGGGFLSTPTDLVRFGMAHLRAGFLRPETIRLLWTPQQTADGEATGYGVGWFVDTDRDGRRIISHGGGSIGGTAMLLVFPEQDVVVAMVGNMSQAPTTFSNAWTIAEGFIIPPVFDPALTSPLTGMFQCILTRRGEEYATQSFQLGMSGGEYWGHSDWKSVNDDRTGRERLVAWSADSLDTRLITVGQNGYISNYWLRPDGDGLAGEWSSGSRGEIRCTRA